MIKLRQYDCLKNDLGSHVYDHDSWPCCRYCGESLYQDGHGLYVRRYVIREELLA